MNYARAYILAAITGLCLVALAVVCAVAIAATAAPVPLAVSLDDARRPPAYLHYVRPGGEATPRRAWRDTVNGYPCRGGGYFMDVSAYTWRGRALGAQSYDSRESMTYWPTRHGSGRVGYDGLTFYNGTRSPVLVAGWCDV